MAKVWRNDKMSRGLDRKTGENMLGKTKIKLGRIGKQVRVC